MQSMPDLIAPSLSAEVALKFFKGAQGEAPLKEHAVDYEYHADFEEWLTCLWRCVRLLALVIQLPDLIKSNIVRIVVKTVQFCGFSYHFRIITLHHLNNCINNFISLRFSK